MRYLTLLSFILLLACNKDDITNTSPSGNNHGKIIYNYFGGLICVDVSTMTRVWEKPDLFATPGNVPFYDTGVVFTSSMYGASAVYANNGNIKWQIRYGYIGYQNWGLRYTGSPLVKDGLLYILGFSGMSGDTYLYCIDANTGVIKWQQLIVTSFDHYDNVNMPVITGDKILIAGYDWNNKNKVLCYNRLTGTLIWQLDLYPQGIYPSAYPQTDGSRFYIYNHRKKEIVSFDVNTGEKKWTTKPTLGGLSRSNKMYVEGEYLYANGEFNSQTKLGTIYKIHKTTGEVADYVSTTEPFNSIFVDASGIYASAHNAMARFNKETLVREWTTPSPFETRYGDSAFILNFFFPSELVATEQFLYTSTTTHFRESPRHCDAEFMIWDKKSGKILKRTELNGCTDFQLPEKFIYVEDNKPYYPSTGGLKE